ncbi:MAG TPA: condensation domain-containing protein [Gaiellaceae bacterium]
MTSTLPETPGAVRTEAASFQQEQLWLIERTVGDGGLYNELYAIRFDGEIDVALLERALAAVVARHEILRTTHRFVDGRLVQDVRAAEPASTVGVEDLSSVAAADREQALLAYARAYAEEPFDLERGPLLRVALVRLAEREHVLLVGAHHVATDGASMHLFLDELGARYAELEAELEPPRQYAEFARWQRGALDEGLLEREAAFWTETLEGAPTVLELPTEQVRPRRKRLRGRRERFELDAQLAAVVEVASALDCTPFTVLLAAFEALVYRYTNRDDFVLGTGASGRPPGFERTLGFFANMVPLRLKPRGDATFAELVEECAERFYDALDHELLPFEKLVELVNPERDASATPLVQVVFAMWEARSLRPALGDARGRLIDVPRDRARFDLLVEVVVTDETPLALFVEYDDALFAPDDVARLVRHYERVLAGGLADPGATVASLPLLAPDDLALLGADGRTVRDRDGNVAPPGVVGELQPAGTRPVLARRRGDGELVEVGLPERRLSVGDFTVQLEAVETALRELPGVADAAVVPSRVAYVTGADADEVRRLVGASLPAYLAPSRVVAVPEIVRRDGVPDEEALASFASESARPEARHPHLEAALAAVWSEVLAVGDVRPDDDFFELGGHSMLAAQLTQRIGEALGVEVPLLAIFERCTVAELAAELELGHPGLEAALAEIETLPDDAFAELLGDAPAAERTTSRPEPERELPLSAAQLQIWISEQLGAGEAKDFVAALLYRIRGPLDAAALDHALREVVARHAPLRSAIVLSGETPLQRVADEVEVTIPLEELSHLAPAEREDAVAARAREEAERPFDLAHPPLMRARLLRLAADEHALVLVQHHLVTDGVSMDVLTRELGELYRGRVTGRAPRLPELAVPYPRYVEWERQWLAGEEAERMRRFWRTRLADAPALELQAGRVATERPSLVTGACRHVLPASVTRGLGELARACRVTKYMAVSAAWAAVLADWSGQDDVLIGTTVDNRPLPGLAETIGCFVNLVTLRLDCTPARFDELVRRVRGTIVEAYTHQALPFREVLAAAGVGASDGRMPLFQVTSDWVDERQVALELEGCAVEYAHVPLGTLRFELALYGIDRGETLELELEHAAGLWDPDAVADRLGQVAALLAEAAARSERPVAELVRAAAGAPANVAVTRAA